MDLVTHAGLVVVEAVIVVVTRGISLEYQYISIHRQAEILARKQKQCYPERVVFFIYRNMTLSNTLSESSQLMTEQVLDQDARLRASTVASEAIAILDKNPDAQLAIQKTFQEMVSGNLRDPENIRKIQD